MTRACVSPELLRWARERAGLSTVELEAKFPKLADWENVNAQPTLKQLEAYARATRTPICRVQGAVQGKVRASVQYPAKGTSTLGVSFAVAVNADDSRAC